MIKAHIENIETIKNKHLNGTKVLVESRLREVRNVIELIDIDDFGSFDVSVLQKLNISSKKTRDAYSKAFESLDALKFVSLFINDLSSERLSQILIGGTSELQSLYKIEAAKFKSKALKACIEYIFDYDVFSNRDSSGYNAFELAAYLNQKVCLYCNRNYTSTIANKKEKITRPYFDHFIPRSKFPLFGLSLFNLVPCCSICNSILKGGDHFNFDNLLSPYEDGFGNEIRFKSRFKKGVDEKGKIMDLFEICLDANDKNTPKCRKVFPTGAQSKKGNIQVFKLEELYNDHKDVLSEIVFKANYLNENYCDEILKLFSGLGSNRDEFYRFYFANYYDEKDFSKRPLSKFTRDIVDDVLGEDFMKNIGIT